MHTYCSIDGTTAVVRWDDPGLGEVLGNVFGYLGLSCSDTPPAAAEIALDFSAAGRPPALPAGACEAARYESGVTAWQAGAHLFLSDGTSVVQIAPVSGTARGHLAPLLLEETAARYTKLIALFTLSLFILLRRRGFYPLHAAALVRDGCGLLLAAGSGSGKSTLSYSLVRQGWHYLSDDSVLLRPAGAQVEVLAFRRHFGLLPETRRRFPELTALGTPQLTDRRKQCIPLAQLYPAQAADRCLPAVLLFPEIADAPESRLSPVGKSDALLGLIRQSALVTLEPDVTPQHLDVLRRLLQHTRAYRLEAGRDLRDDPARIGRLLAPLLPQRGPVQASRPIQPTPTVPPLIA